MSRSVVAAQNTSFHFQVTKTQSAERGNKEMAISGDREMPGLMAIREEYGKRQPLKGAHRRMSAYDDLNGCFDRDAHSSGRVGTLVVVQYLFDARPCRGGYCGEGHSGLCLKGETRRRILVVRRPNDFRAWRLAAQHAFGRWRRYNQGYARKNIRTCLRMFVAYRKKRPRAFIVFMI